MQRKRKKNSFINEEIKISDDENFLIISKKILNKIKSEYFINNIVVHMNVILVVPCAP